MADVMEHVAYLSEEIGPRPAGTEEEQQAALYITEHMQKEAGLSAVIEDFTAVADSEMPRAVCSAVTLVFSLVALVFPVVGLPAAIIAALSAAIYIAEAFDKPLLSRLVSRGVSQNVVAKYEPGYSPESGGTRRRKVVVVAHYDSGKARPELVGPIVMALPIVKWVVLGSFVAVALVLFMGSTVFASASGAVDVVMNVLTVIFMIVAALPLVQFILHKAASYNDGANCNASGVAALMEVASRVGRGRTDMSSLEQEDPVVTIHGEQAARAEGVIPEGASVSYQAAPTVAADDNASPAERLAAAKAAVAALSGKPVSDFMSEAILNASKPDVHSQKEASGVVETFTPEDIQNAAASQEAGMSAPADASAPEAPVPVQQPAQQPIAESQAPAQEKSGGLPDWFVAAQKKAKRSSVDDKPVQRSRYADALEAAVTESSGYFEEANNAVISNARERMEAFNDGIVEIKAPESAWLQVHPDSGSVDAMQEQKESTVEESTPGPAPQEPQPAQEDVASVDLGATTPCPILPIDLSVPDIDQPKEVPLPSFLREQPQQQPSEPRTADRVSVSADSSISGDTPDQEVSAEPQEPVVAAPVFVETVTSATGEILPIDEATVQQHRSISLPAIEDSAQPAVQVEMLKQRAPLAERGEKGKAAAKNLLNGLPSIDSDRSEVRGGGHGISAAELRSSLPSLSGALPKASAESSTVSLTGSFAPVGATSAFAPVGDELLEDVDPDDIYVDDADDSDYQETYTDAGAFAGPDYVEMPKSRVRRLLDRFHHKKKDAESTPQEWLNVSDDFEARSVGAARGSWESFRDDRDDLQSSTQPQQSAAYADAYSDGEFDEYDSDEEFGYEDDRGSDRKWFGGAFSRIRMGRVDMRSGKEDEPPIEGEDPSAQQPEAPEMQKIYQFRNPDINTEVWFVALGAELAGHSGMRAFVQEHAQDLRGAIIIELEALGAGTLSMIDCEGGYRVAKTSSRMKRYTRKASHATGLSIGSASMLWKGSASSYAITHGLQAMHLVGMDGAKPAAFGAKEDAVADVDEKLLNQRADYVMELLKNI